MADRGTGHGWLTKGTKISEMQSNMINLNQISQSVKILERPQTNQMANLQSQELTELKLVENENDWEK